jgi:hypothetical protein
MGIDQGSQFEKSAFLLAILQGKSTCSDVDLQDRVGSGDEQSQWDRAKVHTIQSCSTSVSNNFPLASAGKNANTNSRCHIQRHLALRIRDSWWGRDAEVESKPAGDPRPAAMCVWLCEFATDLARRKWAFDRIAQRVFAFP